MRKTVNTTKEKQCMQICLKTKSETKYNKQGIIARVKEMFNIKTKTKKSQK